MLGMHKTASSASLVIQKFVPTLLTHISPNSRPFLVGIVSVPDGYIACLYGPVPAKTHDAKLLHESNLMEQLCATMPDDNSNGPIYSLYGDLAYPQSPYLLGGYCNVANRTDEAQFN